MMMKNHDELVERNQSPNWPYIPDDPYKFLIIGDPGSDKTNALLNLIKYQQRNIDKIYLSIKDIFESKYQLLIMEKKK